MATFVKAVHSGLFFLCKNASGTGSKWGEGERIGHVEMHRLPLVLMEGGSHIAADSGMLMRMDMKQSGQEKCFSDGRSKERRSRTGVCV